VCISRPNNTKITTINASMQMLVVITHPGLRCHPPTVNMIKAAVLVIKTISLLVVSFPPNYVKSVQTY
jgi:hypothetical protein